MDVPPEYHGREQSWLKHRFLTEYLRAWAHKLGSKHRRLWYVDVFAGPWKSKDAKLHDTSIYIGLNALEEAAETWRHSHDIEVKAVFVEKDPDAYDQLEAFLQQREGIVQTRALCGKFGDHVESIAQMLGDDCAFIFVDPTGFKGVEMQYIAPLVEPRYRDVLINVMFNHINRFKDDTREFLREQMRAFFGLDVDTHLPEALSETALLRTYREQLKHRSALVWAADIAVPHPTIERTWFRLVVGGKHPEVLDVFREAERRVIGTDAGLARTDAKLRSAANQPLFTAGQLSPGADARYAEQRDRDLGRAVPMIHDRLAQRPEGLKWREIWPPLLEELHVPLNQLAGACLRAHRDGELLITPAPGARRKKAHDDDLIHIGPRAPTVLDGRRRP